MRLLRCMAVAILLGMLLETQSVFAYGGIPVRYYDEVLVMVANGENNSGPPHLLLDTTSIVVQKMRDQYGVKYSFIAYFYKDGKVDTSNPDLFELWALKNSAYGRITDDITDKAPLSIPMDDVMRFDISNTATRNLMATIFEFMPKDN